MERFGYGLSELIADLRVIVADAADAREIVEQACPLTEWVSQKPGYWLPAHRFETDSQKGFGTAVLHEEPGMGFTVCAVVWPPGGCILPHNHRTWEILSPVYGTVCHSFWIPTDGDLSTGDGLVELGSEMVMQTGQAAGIMPREIHALENIGPAPGLTMHIYGCELAQVERSHFGTR